MVAFGLIGTLLVGSLGGGCGAGQPPGGAETAEDGVIAAVGAGGEGAAFANHNGTQSWTQTSTLTVPAGARQLFIGSEPGTDNPDLDGAQVKLTSPDGTQTITLADGAVTCSGLPQQALTAPATDAALQAHLEALAGELPQEPTDADWLGLSARMARGDTTLPALPDGVLDEVANQGEQWDQAEGVVAGEGDRTPSNGLLVVGPQPGQWTMEVTCDAGARAFTALAFAVPGRLTEAALSDVADALSAQATTSQARGVAGRDCTGCDPGCNQDFDSWKRPAFLTPHWFYVKGIKTLFAVVTWYLLRQSFTKAIDVLLALYAIDMGIAQEEYKAAVIFLLSRVYAFLLKSYSTAENAYLRGFYCFFNYKKWCQVCYIGVGWGQVVLWPGQIESLERAAGQSQDVSIVAANAMLWTLQPENWGQTGPLAAPKSAKWECEPADLLELTPRATGNSWCAVKGPDAPESTEGQLSVTIEDQPGKFTCAVTITVRYVLAGSSDGTGLLNVDDDLDVYVNGELVYTDGSRLSGSRAPIVLDVEKGDTIRLVVRDTYGHCSGLGAVWLVRGGQSTMLTQGFNEGCGHPGGNQGIKFDQTFTVPF